MKPPPPPSPSPDMPPARGNPPSRSSKSFSQGRPPATIGPGPQSRTPLPMQNVSRDDSTIQNGKLGRPPPPPIRTVSHSRNAPPPPPGGGSRRPSQPPPPPPGPRPNRDLPPPPPPSHQLQDNSGKFNIFHLQKCLVGARKLTPVKMQIVETWL